MRTGTCFEAVVALSQGGDCQSVLIISDLSFTLDLQRAKRLSLRLLRGRGLELRTPHKAKTLGRATPLEKKVV